MRCTCRASVASLRRKRRRAGTLKNRSRTSTSVPSGKAAGRRAPSSPLAAFTSYAVCSYAPCTDSPWAPRRRVTSLSVATAEIDGRASPRKPSDWTAARSSSDAILLVAWRVSASGISSGAMPSPSSRTRISAVPPRSVSISMRVAPASMAFSTSSLTTEAGRSTTSPAAIWSMRWDGRTRIGMCRGFYRSGARGSGSRVAGDDGRGAATSFALPREEAAIRRAAAEILPHAIEDGLGDGLLVSLGTQLLLFSRIGDVGRLHQHGRNVRRLQHHERGLLHLGLADGTHTVQLSQHALGRHHARADAGGLRYIHQHRGQLVVLVAQRHTALEVHRVFLLGEPAGCLARCAAVGEHIHRGARDLAPGDRIRMDGDEDVGARIARDADALAQRNEAVFGAREYRAHARLRVDALLERAGDGQHHVLLAR